MERKQTKQWSIIALFLAASWIAPASGARPALSHGQASARAPEPQQAPAAADTTATLQLTLNIPSFRLDVVEHGVRTRSYPVATGMPRFRTPVGSFGIDYVVWNPWWRPPPSEWARKERPQRPGWKNPVGRVKMHVHDLVFLHGSPLEASMGSAASHACIRMRNVDAMALARLVHAHASPDVPMSLLDSLVTDTARTRQIGLTRVVPIHLRYELAEVDGGEVFVFRDVYRLGGTRVPDARTSVLRALAESGVDTTQIDPVRLRTLIRSARRATTRTSVDSLLLAPDRGRLR